MPKPAVFLDRDDTLIANSSLDWPEGTTPGDLCDPSRVSLLPGALEGCHLLHAAGFSLVMVTNQGLVARGNGTIDDVERTNRRVSDLLTSNGTPLLTATYYCPYHPKGTVERYAREHPWRKPSGGMIAAAAQDLDLDLRSSWLIGDAQRDIDAALDAGIAAERTIHIGPPRADQAAHDQSAPDMLAAALIVLAHRTTETGVVTGRLTASSALHAPLADASVRRIVISTGHAIAERVGVDLTAIEADDHGVTVSLRGTRVAAMGFLAELRRLTNAWHRSKHGNELWPTNTPGSSGDGWLDPPGQADPR
ncbi:MAG: HAD-IIIA family hydrolase [Planctomycetota bacterium]